MKKFVKIFLIPTLLLSFYSSQSKAGGLFTYLIGEDDDEKTSPQSRSPKRKKSEETLEREQGFFDYEYPNFEQYANSSEEEQNAFDTASLIRRVKKATARHAQPKKIDLVTESLSRKKKELESLDVNKENLMRIIRAMGFCLVVQYEQYKNAAALAAQQQIKLSTLKSEIEESKFEIEQMKKEIKLLSHEKERLMCENIISLTNINNKTVTISNNISGNIYFSNTSEKFNDEESVSEEATEDNFEFTGLPKESAGDCYDSRSSSTYSSCCVTPEKTPNSSPNVTPKKPSTQTPKVHITPSKQRQDHPSRKSPYKKSVGQNEIKAEDVANAFNKFTEEINKENQKEQK